jgi:hypothetical protein
MASEELSSGPRGTDVTGIRHVRVRFDISAQHLVYCQVYFALLSLSASNELSLDAALNLQPTG